MNELEKTRFLDLLEADQSDPDVQYELGRCYLTGTGVEKNGREAEGWLRRAAEQGHEGAAALLASAEESQEKRAVLSEDTLPDWCEAAEGGDAQAQYEIAAYFLDNPDPAWESDVMRYLEMAVDQGHPKACLRLGELLLERDAGRAVVHLRNAAECGESRAMELLGECYARGRGVERNVNQAEEWFVAWAQRGSGEDMLKLACRYKAGDGVPRSLGRGLSWLKRAQLAGAADAEARYNGGASASAESRPESRGSGGAAAGGQPETQTSPLEQLKARAEKGDSQAQLELGRRYIDGDGVPKDVAIGAAWVSMAADQGFPEAEYFWAKLLKNHPEKSKFLHWLQQAAQHGLPVAQFELACMYEKGNIVPQDDRQAVYWFRQAAEQGDEAGELFLAEHYRNGCGVEQDNAQYLHWLSRSAGHGNSRAQCFLGNEYREGTLVPQDFAKAADLYRRAAEQGFKYGQQQLALCYREGVGVEKDEGKYMTWLRRAADQGWADAELELAGRYEEGRLVELDMQQHLYWLRRAAEHENATAEFLLSLYYETGYKVEQSWEQFEYWLRRAAQHGNAGAQRHLADLTSR